MFQLKILKCGKIREIFLIYIYWFFQFKPNQVFRVKLNQIESEINFKLRLVQFDPIQMLGNKGINTSKMNLSRIKLTIKIVHNIQTLHIIHNMQSLEKLST